MAPLFTARLQLLLLQAMGFLIGLIGQAARAFSGPKFDSMTTPPVTEPLLLLSGVQLAKLIRQRKVRRRRGPIPTGRPTGLYERNSIPGRFAAEVVVVTS